MGTICWPSGHLTAKIPHAMHAASTIDHYVHTRPSCASGLGSARAPAVEEAAGRLRDRCALAHAQLGHLSISGIPARRPDPQPRWHRA
jgi:hypothetical protein